DAGVTITNSIGLCGYSHNWAGAVTNSIGVQAESFLEFGNTMTNATGVQGSVQTSGTGSTISSAYGGNFFITNASSTVTNGYGVYVGNIQSTNKWSLYASDATAPSYFAGNVGIGTST